MTPVNALSRPSFSLQPVTAARWLLIGTVIALLITPPLANVLQAVLVALFVVSGELRRRLLASLRQPMVLAALAFYLVLAAGVLYAVAPPSEGLHALASWRKLLFLPLAAALFDTPAAKRQLAYALVAATAALALVSFVMLPMGIGYRAGDFPGIIARNHGTQGMVFAAGAFVAAVLAMEAGERQWRIALVLAAVLLIANTVVVSGARSGYLVLLVCAAAFAWARAWRGKGGLAAKLGTTCAALLVVTAAMVASPHARERVAEAVQETLHYDSTTTITSMGIRQVFWRNTLGLIAQRPVFGWGTASFERVYGDAVQGRPGIAGTRTGDPHNQYLKITAEQGLVGLLVFLAFLASCLRQRATMPWRLLGLGVLASWCATSLWSSHFSTFAEGTFVYLWVGAMLAREPDPAA